MSLSQETLAKAQFDKGWIAGLAYSVQILGRWGEEQHAAVLLGESGMQYNDFDGVDPYDRKEVRRIFRTQPELRDLYEARKRK